MPYEYIRYIFIVANLGIFLAYISIAFRRVVHIQSIFSATRLWGVLFFVTCGLTHLFMAGMTYWSWHLHDTLPYWFVLNHVIQLVAAWYFFQTTGAEKQLTGETKLEFKESPTKTIVIRRK